MRVLVVVDMQNDFIDGTLGTPEAQAIVPKVIKKIEEFDGVILHTLRGSLLSLLICPRRRRGQTVKPPAGCGWLRP